MNCQRCYDCVGQEHHWIHNSEFGNAEEEDWEEEDGPRNEDYAYICKHCPAIAGECEECEGEGCGDCKGTGIVSGLAYTAWRNDLDA